MEDTYVNSKIRIWGRGNRYKPACGTGLNV